ncbi:hypothetical protein BDI_0547 [Parabacteroides distasonis ATCC 8503]|uniref:Uncharacterized protein n=1 Tax=Parabacteroides distasonis (strain ATCC 8503 / DSM 20701 / CIP 104284 / JCM 5825 / NCTC 11152) TaxID=435591 RepID=A6L9F9_PARD8|nr:hypothetical protein BDI_0547 [Parabacteroides distasonis ATCC 8503]PNL09218.1 hypothetical protein CEQ22_014905 [Parabacteroides distasonis]
MILLKSSFLFLVYRHGNRDEMISYFLHHHVPSKKSNIHSCRDVAYPVSSPPNGNLKILSDSGRRDTPRLYNRVITVLAPFRLLPK